MSSAYFTCYLCEDHFQAWSWDELVYCKCKATGVDYDPLYTRFIGLPPVESPMLKDVLEKNPMIKDGKNPILEKK